MDAGWSFEKVYTSCDKVRRLKLQQAVEPNQEIAKGNLAW